MNKVLPRLLFLETCSVHPHSGWQSQVGPAEPKFHLPRLHPGGAVDPRYVDFSWVFSASFEAFASSFIPLAVSCSAPLEGKDSPSPCCRGGRRHKSGHHLEDHPRTCKWLITMFSKSFRVDGTPSKWPKSWLINGGDPSDLLSGIVILQADGFAAPLQAGSPHLQLILPRSLDGEVRMGQWAGCRPPKQSMARK